MTKHVADHEHASDGGRLQNFTQQERESSTHPAVDTLRSRPRDRDEASRRTAEFARIQRGETA